MDVEAAKPQAAAVEADEPEQEVPYWAKCAYLFALVWWIVHVLFAVIPWWKFTERGVKLKLQQGGANFNDTQMIHDMAVTFKWVAAGFVPILALFVVAWRYRDEWIHFLKAMLLFTFWGLNAIAWSGLAFVAGVHVVAAIHAYYAFLMA